MARLIETTHTPSRSPGDDTHINALKITIQFPIRVVYPCTFVYPPGGGLPGFPPGGHYTKWKVCGNVGYERGNRAVEDGLPVDLYHLLYSSSATRASSTQFTQDAEGSNMLVCTPTMYMKL